MMGSEQRAPSLLRAVALGLFCEWLLFSWVAASEISSNVYLICYSLLYPAVALLAGLALVNSLLHRLAPALALSRREIIVIYIMVTCSLPLAGFGMMRFLIPSLVLPFHLASQPGGEKWEVFRRALHPALAPGSEAAVRDFLSGSSAVPWAAWALPLAWWGGLFAALSAAQLALAYLLRDQWIRNERLTFPIVYLPVEFVVRGERVAKRGLLWAGFSIPFILQSLLALNYLFPVIPAFTLKAWFYQPFVALPWRAFGGIAIGWYPIATGLAYFIPTDISFSCWFFLLLMGFVKVGFAALGLRVEEGAFGESRFPYLDEQAAGSWIAYAGLVIWLARRQLRSSLTSQSRAPRAAWITLFASLVFLTAFSQLLQVPAALLGAIVILYLAYVVVAARVRAEVGTQWTFAPHIMNPNYVALAVTGTKFLPSQALASLSIFEGITVDVRGQPMPYQMEAFKMGEEADIASRRIAQIAALSIATGLLFAFWTSMGNWYATGLETAKADRYHPLKVHLNFDRTQEVIANPLDPNLAGLGAMAIAAFFTLMLARCRASWLGWPFHPLGYVLANTITIRAFWMSYAFATVAKWLVLRYGGAGLYRRSISFFVGIILGDALAQALWSLAGYLLRFPVYQFLT
jgi:hypothetical protein